MTQQQRRIWRCEQALNPYTLKSQVSKCDEEEKGEMLLNLLADLQHYAVINYLDYHTIEKHSRELFANED